MITLDNHRISAKIKDRYAISVYSFDFINASNNASELEFEITIDPDAFISKFEANIDGILFIGETKEKETAAKEYKEAKKKKENAILISQPHDDIPNVFKISTNIDKGSSIELNITIEQYLKKKFDFSELTIQILRNFEKYNIKELYQFIQFEFNVEDQCGIYNVSIPSASYQKVRTQSVKDRLKSAPTHSGVIVTEQLLDPKNKTCTIKGKIKSLNSDINELSLKYKIKGENEDSQCLYDNKSNTFCHIYNIPNILSDYTLKEQMNNVKELYPTPFMEGTNNDKDIGESYTFNDTMIVPRRVIFVIDKSGSMSGGKWRRAVSATINALKLLRQEIDRFNIILFNSSVHKLFDGIMLVNNESIDKAIKYMESNSAGGGTKIDKPLKEAINIIKNDVDTNNYFVNQVIFMTDGKVSNTKEILVNINKMNNLNGIDKYNKKVSIFTFGVGKDGNDSGWIKDVNHSFLKSLAVNNNGFYKRIKQSNTDSKLSEYFNILSRPILTNIKVEYHNKNIQELTETHFNSLYSGNDIIITGKMMNIKEMTNIKLSATITGITGQIIESDDDKSIVIKPMDINKKIDINFDLNGIENENTERIWAYLKLQQLSKQKLITHNDMIEWDDDEEKEEKSLGMELGMKYKFVTPWTSMIVVKKKDQNEIQCKDKELEKHKRLERIKQKEQEMERAKQEMERNKNRFNHTGNMMNYNNMNMNQHFYGMNMNGMQPISNYGMNMNMNTNMNGYSQQHNQYRNNGYQTQPNYASFKSKNSKSKLLLNLDKYKSNNNNNNNAKDVPPPPPSGPPPPKASAFKKSHHKKFNKSHRSSRSSHKTVS